MARESEPRIRYREIFHSADFAKPARCDARAQRPLWASTSTKNPTYADVKYIEPLVGEGAIDTMPQTTLSALLDHADIEPDAVSEDAGEAARAVHELALIGVDLSDAPTLQDDAIKKFSESLDSLLNAAAEKQKALVRSTS